MTVLDEARRYRLIARLASLSAEHFSEVESFVDRLLQRPATVPAPASPSAASPSGGAQKPVVEPDWPHAPLHRLSASGTYFVTCGTYQKRHHFRGAERLDHLHAELLRSLKEGGWQLEAWAVFSNHYHFVAHLPPDATPLGELLMELHRRMAIYANELDQEPGRQVWHNYWDTRLTIETSYFARLAYTHNNAVEHGLVPVARLYPWCSAGWFERTAKPAQVATMANIETDRVNVPDEYEPLGV